jgi:predicted deacylase
VPTVVANGTREGPTLWITGGIHGDEATGVAVAQDAMDAIDPTTLSGSVVCVLTLNPAGLRRNRRRSYYHDDDPNRGFPAPESDRHEPPDIQELIDRRIYDAFADEADALLDLHTAGVGSMPFVIRDRVLYGQQRDHEQAQALASGLDDLARSTNLPVVNEYAAAEYTGKSLQRSTPPESRHSPSNSGATASSRRPAVARGWPPSSTSPSTSGSWRRFRRGSASNRTNPPSPPVDFAVKRYRGPRTEDPGICRHRVSVGDVLEE